jgi:hypothetical protein
MFTFCTAAGHGFFDKVFAGGFVAGLAGDCECIDMGSNMASAGKRNERTRSDMPSW